MVILYNNSKSQVSGRKESNKSIQTKKNELKTPTKRTSSVTS